MIKTSILCHFDDLSEGASKGIYLTSSAFYADILLIRKGKRVYAYRNNCPHTGAPMEWQPHQFLDSTGDYILCGIHGARFRIHDGYCIAGPCAGCFLTKVAVAVAQGKVLTAEGLERRRG